MLVSARAPRICSSLHALRAYARVRADSAHILVSARAPRVCSSLRGLRAYARLYAGSARMLVLSLIHISEPTRR
eukprot:5083989-Lingulodinium_polyedra.AAC.1